MIPGWQMEAYQRLRGEIIRQAVKDYKNALRRSDRLGAVCTEQIDLERWFLSKWGQMLSGDNGEYIIELCKKTYKLRRFDYCKVELPEEVLKSIHADLQAGMARRKISRKYDITRYKVDDIARRWNSETRKLV